VKRSSRPKKSPCSKQISLHDEKSMSPRLWYRRTSFSHAGFLAARSPGSTTGTRGKLPAFRQGNVRVPA
jgi:hypothetical protein